MIEKKSGNKSLGENNSWRKEKYIGTEDGIELVKEYRREELKRADGEG
jgi:hypothetical protein